MKNKNIISRATIIAALVTPQVLFATNKKPNFLILVCEDITHNIGCFGDNVASTPYLDKFSKQSILHTHMFTTVGVSSPSRYSLITGRYSSIDGANFMRVTEYNKKFGVVPPSGVKCYTEFLRSVGYYCTNNSKTDYQFPVPISAWDEQGKNAHWKNAPTEQPFLAIFNIGNSGEASVWQGTNRPLEMSPEEIVVPPYFPDTEIVRRDMAVMYTNIADMDRIFNEYIGELMLSDRAENTIVIFLSDNGGPLPRQKREIKDSGTLVPFMISFPCGKGGGSIVEQMNMFVDIPATVLSLAGVKPPKYMHGEAMYGEYKNETSREFVFGATDRFDTEVEKRASIRDKQFLYIYNYMPNQSLYQHNEYRSRMPMMQEMVKMNEEGRLNDCQKSWFSNKQPIEELYDCVKDPHQINNLATHLDYQKVLKQMRKAYRKEWINKYNKEWEQWTEDQFIERAWPNGEKPKCESPIIIEKDGFLHWKNKSDEYTLSYQIDGKGKNGKGSNWNIYSAPISAMKGSKMSFIISRIGYENSTIKILNNNI